MRLRKLIMNILNDSQLLNDFFTVNNVYSTGDGYLSGGFINGLFLLIIYLLFLLIRHVKPNSNKKIKINSSERPVVPLGFEKFFKWFKNSCTNLGFGTPFKKWNSYQEYINHFHDSIEKDETQKIEESKFQLAVFLLYTTIVIVSFLFIHNLYNLSTIPSKVSIIDDNTAMLHYNLTSNMVIARNDVLNIEVTNKSKSSGNKIRTTVYYCEVKLAMSSGEVRYFNVSSLGGKFPSCKTK